jgi:hypothetical protein
VILVLIEKIVVLTTFPVSREPVFTSPVVTKPVLVCPVVISGTSDTIDGSVSPVFTSQVNVSPVSDASVGRRSPVRISPVDTSQVSTSPVGDVELGSSVGVCSPVCSSLGTVDSSVGVSCVGASCVGSCSLTLLVSSTGVSEAEGCELVSVEMVVSTTASSARAVLKGAKDCTNVMKIMRDLSTEVIMFFIGLLNITINNYSIIRPYR